MNSVPARIICDERGISFPIPAKALRSGLVAVLLLGTVSPGKLAATDATSPTRCTHGVAPSPHVFEELQPDGTRVKLRLRGSATRHWLEDTNGFTVLRNRGALVYAERAADGRLRPSGLLVGRANPRAIGLKRGLMPAPGPEAYNELETPEPQVPQFFGLQRSARPFGTVPNLVIPMRFADHTNRTLPSVEDLDILFNARGGHPQKAPTGSVKDYYLENSYDQLTIQSTVVPWVTLPRTEAYYAQAYSGMGSRFKEALTEALRRVDPAVDFTQFDLDGNGWIDAITFLHSGYGAEWGVTDSNGVRSENRIWSHRAGIATWTSAEGVRVMDYHVSSALWGFSGARMARIGVIVHELGHFFGLPDLYDTDGSSPGLGTWCGMANSWGWSGDQLNPPHFSAWCKVKLGWVKPILLNQPGTYSLEPIQTTPAIYMITNGFPAREYLLVENKQPIGFDSEIRQGGLAIWQVDDSKYTNNEEGYPGQAGWPENNHHYQVALLQADGRYDLERDRNKGDDDDLFSLSGIFEISPDTVPSTHSYFGGILSRTSNAFQVLSTDGPVLTFNFDTQGTLSSPARIEPLGIVSGGFELKLVGQPGSTWSLQSSANARDWSTFLSVVIPSSGETNLVDRSTTVQRFYRAAAAR